VSLVKNTKKLKLSTKENRNFLVNPKNKTMKVQIEKITPALAEKYLEHNVSNRKFRKRVADGYATQMRKGQWEEKNGETIQFDIDGNLINGQHRLEGIKESGVTLEFVVVRDLPKEAFAKIDIGLKRTGGDVLYIEGAKQATQLAGCIRRFLLLKKGKGKGELGGENTKGISNADILKEFQKRKRWWNEVNDNATTWYHELGASLPPSDIGGLYAWLHEISSDDASKFFVKLATGAELKMKSPIRQLRSFLQKTRGFRGGSKIKRVERLAIFIKAWNLYRSKSYTERLVYNSSKEEFPIPE
jgi:hypothetical protein